MSDITRAEVEARDRDDPLAPMREAFDLPALVYLNGNSLGALPKRAGERIRDVVDRQWGEDLVGGWNVHDWISLPERVGARIAPLIGAGADEVVCDGSTSVDLFKVVVGALRASGRRRIVTEAGNFPTDLYILQGIEQLFDETVEVVAAPREAIADALDAHTAALVLTHVDYKSAEIWDMAATTRMAHAHGALMIWDLSHSAGAMPLDLNAAGADLAVGCTYKYLNGGPGAPAYLFVARRHQTTIENALSGWMGHAAPFEFADRYRPAEGIRRMLTGTPVVTALSLVETALELWEDVDMAQLRDKSMALGDLFIELIEQHCGDAFALASPREAERRGSHVSLTHPEGYAIMQALRARGIIGDFRAPDIMRFGFAPLYQRYADVWATAEALGEILEGREWERGEYRKRARVT